MKKELVKNGVHTYTAADQYVPPEEKEVREHVDWFMGLKLGFMMHWAPGCQLGTLESWPLSDGDAPGPAPMWTGRMRKPSRNSTGMPIRPSTL